METIDKIKAFLKVDDFPNSCGYGNGYGNDYGSGDVYSYSNAGGNGSGYGSGGGYSYGNGNGSGYGDCYGDSYGDGCGFGNYDRDIESLNGQHVYIIDETQTIITQVIGLYAKGFILGKDLTQKPCYIAKCGNSFAHGETLKDAFRDAREKYEEHAPLEERIASFNTFFPENDKPVSGRVLFSWHHILTGSCLMGRENFCREHGLEIDAEYTIREFIRLTEHAYGKDAIKQLKESRDI